jgi:hypothetical protein
MYKGIDDQGPFYKVSYYFTDWADSDMVANQLRGYSSRVGSTTIRSSPHQHPLSPNLVCMSVDIEGCGQPSLNSSGLPYYSAGFFAHCTYRVWTAGPIPDNDPNYNNQIDPTTPVLWATQELDFGTEEYVHEKNQYTWSTGDALNGKMSGIPIRVSIGIVTMTITYHQLPYLPMTTVRNLRNRINNATFLGAAQYTVRFMGARTVRDFNTDGTVCQKVQLTFKEREADWNKFLRKDKLQFDYIVDSSSNKVFTAADLSPLVSL